MSELPPMEFSNIAQHLTRAFGDAIVEVDNGAIDPWVEIALPRWLEVAEVLRNDDALAFDYLNCITGVDYLEIDPKKATKTGWQPHLEVVYHLLSLRHRHRLVVKIQLPRGLNDQPGNLPQVPSVTSVWSTANWHEREVYDLIGVEFTDHPGLRRILCPEDWQGHPLRKDYEMPLEYHGIRGR